MSKKSPDRRPYCGIEVGAGPTASLYGCYQQYVTSSEAVPVLTNVTSVQDYASGSSGYIAPYGRPASDTSPNCGAYYVYVCHTPSNGQMYCEIPEGTSSFAPAGGGTSSFSVGSYPNLYITSSATQSFANCKSSGFKNVYASKKWHGWLPYTAHEHGAKDDFSYDCTCAWQSEHYTPTQTKYLRMDISASSFTTTTKSYWNVLTGDTEDCGCATNECVVETEPTITEIWTNRGSATQTIQIDRYSGNSISTCASSSTFKPCWDSLVATHTPGGGTCDYTYTVTQSCFCNTDLLACRNAITSSSIDSANGAPWDLVSMAASTNASIYGLFCDAIPDTSPDQVTGSIASGSMILKWITTVSLSEKCCDPTSSVDLVTTQIQVSRDSLSISEFGNDYSGRGQSTYPCKSPCYNWKPISFVSYEFTETTFTYVESARSIFATNAEIDTGLSVVATLSEPYTAADCLGDAQGLLGYWDLGDDVLYPWRTDSNINVGPYVHYDETGGGATPGTCTSNTASSGTVIGGPGPRGIDRVWCPSHPNWCICTDYPFGSPCRHLYIDTYGAWSSNAPTGVPVAASDWVDDWHANGIPQGAFAMMNRFSTTPGTCNAENQFIDDVVWVCKYAEIIQPRNSINFARPCNEDRLQIESTQARCLNYASGSELFVDDALADGDDVFWVCGTSNDGLHRGTVTGGYTITLGECLLSASATSFNPSFGCDTATGVGMIAPMRWDVEATPGICGRVDITAASNTNPVTCSIKEPCVLLNGDTVTIQNAIGNTGINGTWDIQVINETTVALLGCDGTTGTPYVKNGQMSSIWGADWKWNDEGAKGDYTTITWEHDFREYGEWERYNGQAAVVGGVCGADASTEPRTGQLSCGLSRDVTNVTCTTNCLPLNACAPPVAYFAPEGQDNFRGESHNHGFGGGLLDARWGNLWNGVIKQAIGDPFWKAPPCPCDVHVIEGEDPTYGCNVTWRSDDGTCLEDTIDEFDNEIRYYPKQTDVEARCEVPDGAPALPTGVYIGCLTPDELAGGSPCPAGNVCNAPYADNNDWPSDDGCPAYKQHVYATPWVTYQNELGCVCDGGRFQTEYEDAGIVCNDGFVSPP